MYICVYIIIQCMHINDIYTPLLVLFLLYSSIIPHILFYFDVTKPIRLHRLRSREFYSSQIRDSKYFRSHDNAFSENFLGYVSCQGIPWYVFMWKQYHIVVWQDREQGFAMLASPDNFQGKRPQRFQGSSRYSGPYYQLTTHEPLKRNHV